MAIKSLTYRIYPTTSQEQMFNQFCGNNRFVWNHMLMRNIKHHFVSGKFLFGYDMCKELPKLKEEHEWLKLSPSQPLQQQCLDLDKALKNCFKSEFGFPKFKKKRKSKESFRVNQNIKISKSKKSIKIPKIGFIRIKPRININLKDIKNVTIKKQGNNWCLYICHQFSIFRTPMSGRKVGLDLGTVRLATLSNGKVIDKFEDEELLKKIKSTQRKLERRTRKNKKHKMKKIQSISRAKTKQSLSRLNKKLRDKRKDYLDKVSKKLVKKYDMIYIEDLKIKNMTRQVNKTDDGSHRSGVSAKSGLNREILNQSWGQLINMLEYKSLWYNKKVIKVNPKNTSRECSECGFTHKRNRRSQSDFRCLKCGFTMNADHNAAINIKRLGLRLAA